MNKAFIDTNILLYSTGNDAQKSGISRELILYKPTISAQVLNEFINVSSRKYRSSIEAVNLVLLPIRFACEVVPITLETHLLAVDIMRKSNLNIFDANIIAAAELADCDVLYTEDLNHGQRIGRVTILNPFLAT